MFEISWVNLPSFTLGGPAGATDPFGRTQFELTLFSSPELDTGPDKPLAFFLTPQYTLTNMSLEAVPEFFSTIWPALPSVGLLMGAAWRRQTGEIEGQDRFAVRRAAAAAAGLRSGCFKSHECDQALQ